MQIYLIVNKANMKNNEMPYLYIGSDTKDRASYMGSCQSLSSAIEKCGINKFIKTILWSGSKDDLGQLGFKKITELENSYHVKLNVVKDERFYNKATANGKFSTEGTANFRYDGSDKIVNLALSHPDVISGLARGMNKGKLFTRNQESENRRMKTSLERYGTPYPQMSESVKEKLKKPKTEEHKEKLRKPKTEEQKANMRSPKSETHKANMSLNHKNNKGVVQLSLDGIQIKTFSTIKEAALSVYPDAIYGNSRDYISRHCRGFVKSKPKDFIWKFLEEPSQV